MLKLGKINARDIEYIVMPYYDMVTSNNTIILDDSLNDNQEMDDEVILIENEAMMQEYDSPLERF